MLVKSQMRKRVHTVSPSLLIEEARRELLRNRIHHLPVVLEGRLVGIVSDRDLRNPTGKEQFVADVMTLNPMVVSPTLPVDEAARLMRKKQINSLPVVQKGKLVGILTASDVLEAFVYLSGVVEPSCHLLIVGKNGGRAEKQVRKIIERCHGEIVWLHYERGQREARISVRLKGREVDDIVTALQAADFEVSTVFHSARQKSP